MSDLNIAAPARSGTLEAVVLRCGCGAPGSHAGTPCPRPRAEALGVISYWHRNPLCGLVYRVGRAFGLTITPI